ncbi:mitochondrial uncoupling protein 4-like [Mercenaria mercenaria]|uniref:mitochondrial uncoupling protein 4-like n=1 Tax=Mercenaria mercenaria TaxID=6596 RepID=UPI00234E6CB9|nr:mitochondrial uncoupling protein 4-like [Mercenaria mercenaria]
MLKILHGIVTEEGFFKLWQGVPPALYRHIVYTGCRMNIYEVLRDRVFKKNKDGTFSLWKGVIVGSTAGALGQFIASPTDLIKVNMQMEGRRRLEGHPPRVHNVAHAFRFNFSQIYACAGVVAAIMCTPADVVKTRVMNQPIKDGRFVNHRKNLWWMFLAPWSLTFWITYEELRKFTGQSSF